MGKEKTIYETALEQGISRRSFLQMSTALAATLGLNFSQSNQVVKAMETQPRVPVIWLQFQDCTGCSESFIRSTSPKVESVLLNMISLEYTEVLSAASGHHVEEAKKQAMEKYHGNYVLAVEGSIPQGPGFLTIGGVPAKEVLLEAAEGAMAIITYGSCSSWGGIAAAKPNPTNAVAVDELIKDKPIIKVPGCPPVPDVMTSVIAHIITFGALPELDHQKRPKAFYRHRVHDKCNRRAFFDAGLFAESFDDEGAKQGYCLYKLGCKGPTTYSACAEVRWNEGTGYPIQSGNPCIGCTENNFWDNGPFYERRAAIPGTQTTVNPEKVGLYAAGITAAGVAGHAVLTSVSKKNNKEDNNIESKE